MHIDDNTLEKFQNNQMDTNDMIAFLEHLDKCDYCMEQMLDRETTDSPIAPPDYLKDQILARSSSLDVKAEKSVSETAHRMRLFYEGLHTAVGVLAALFLLFCIGQTDFASFGARQSSVPVQVQPLELSGHLREFSRNINEGLSNSSAAIRNYLNDISNKIAIGGK